MGTEIVTSFSSLRAQLESEKHNLHKIDENIKKIVLTSGRFTDRFNSGDYARSGSRIGGWNSYADVDQTRRKPETKTVFSRLSARVQDSDGEEDPPGSKKARVPSAVCRELPTRAAVLRAQGDDEQARTRNRRIFGSLLGTLQKFKQEEIVLQTKEDKKAQVEKKIEEQARQEKERDQKERKTLFVERELKKATIKALEAKMARVQEFESWEVSQSYLGKYIQTKARPNIYWLPKKMSDKAQEKLNSSTKSHEKYLARKRYDLQDELWRIEQKCLRPRGFGAKENAFNYDRDEHKFQENAEIKEENEDRSRKRNKFAMDLDEQERDDSDTEEKHDGKKLVKEEKDFIESKMDTSADQTTPLEVQGPKHDTVHINLTNDINHGEMQQSREIDKLGYS